LHREILSTYQNECEIVMTLSAMNKSMLEVCDGRFDFQEGVPEEITLLLR
jgi:hypothetical protein